MGETSSLSQVDRAAELTSKALGLLYDAGEALRKVRLGSPDDAPYENVVAWHAGNGIEAARASVLAADRNLNCLAEALAGRGE